MPIFRKVNRDFFKTWTPEMAYVLGFFAADGYITLNKRGAHFWCIQITDGELLEWIKEVIGAEHKISTKQGQGNEKILYRLQVGSKEMCNDLRGLGFYEVKTKNMSTPNIPDEYFAHFLRGYFDGDGCVWVGYTHKDRPTNYLEIRTVFTSCSKGFLVSIKKRLEKIGIEGKLRKGKGDYYVLIYSVKPSLKLHDFMYNQSVPYAKQLFLYRKKIIFDRYLYMRP